MSLHLSAYARAGFGPPEWIAITIICVLLFGALLGNGSSGSEFERHGAVLSRKEKRGLIVDSAILLPFIVFVLWRKFVG